MKKIQVKIDGKWRKVNYISTIEILDVADGTHRDVFKTKDIQDIKLVDESFAKDNKCEHDWRQTEPNKEKCIECLDYRTIRPSFQIEELIITNNRPEDPHNVWLAIVENRKQINEIISQVK